MVQFACLAVVFVVITSASLIEHKSSSNEFEPNFCTVDLESGNTSVGSLFRFSHYLFIQLTHSQNQSASECRYFVFDLQVKTFLPHTIQCSQFLGITDSFSRLVGEIRGQSKHITRLLGYGKEGSQLLYRDYKITHDHHVKSKEDISKFHYDPLREVANFTDMGAKLPGHETLLMVLDQDTQKNRRIIGLTRLDGAWEKSSEQDQPKDKYFRAVLVGPSGSSNPDGTSNASLGRIMAGYSSLDNKWLHLVDLKHRVLTVPASSIYRAFKRCVACKVVQLDQESLESENQSKVASIKEHLHCQEVHVHAHSSKGKLSKLLFIQNHFWSNFKKSSAGLAIVCAFCTFLIGIFVYARNGHN